VGSPNLAVTHVHLTTNYTINHHYVKQAWVHRQRYFYKLYHEGKTTQLTPERIELLNSVGFSWSGNSTTPEDVTVMPRPTKPRLGKGKKTPEQEWEHNFQLLLAFKAKHGHLKISAVDDKARNNKLRDWTAWQRREYKRWKEGVQSHVTAEHVRRLAEIGFCWDLWPHKLPTSNTDGSLAADSEPRGNVVNHTNGSNAACTTAMPPGHPTAGRPVCPPNARQESPPVDTAFVGASMPTPAPGGAAPA
jgi:Helicase associated domain